MQIQVSDILLLAILGHMNIRVIVKRLVPRGLFQKIEPLGHFAEAVFFNILYGFPARNMQVIGVTGTNGKTTTAFLIHKMLVESGYNKAGLMTTVGYGIGKDIKMQVHHMTNVPVPELMQRLKWMKSQGVDLLILETTSHALAQHRVWGIPYSIAVVTNLTHEHLDYHKTFERYVAAKRSMFSLTQRNARGRRLGIANADDSVAAEFVAETENSVLYGVQAGDIQAKEVQLRSDGLSYKAETADITYHIESHLPGSFNVYNTLAAVSVGRVLGLTKAQIEQGIAALKGVEGRMTSIEEGQDASIIVDFAHTPDSFEKLFKDLRPVVKGKLIVMFGSAGRRDEAKRAIQGELAGKYADEVVVTEEDDRDIDGIGIMNQIAEGAEKAGKIRDKNLFLIHDRAEAIAFAVGQTTSADDTVLLLGKGHEKTIERADGEHPWDEIGTTKDAVRRLS